MKRYTTTLPNNVNILNLDFTKNEEYGVAETNIGYEIDGEAIDRFAAYENLELLPEDIKKLDELYRKKCEEVARLEKEIEALKSVGMDKKQRIAVLCDYPELQTLVEDGLIDDQFLTGFVGGPFTVPFYVVVDRNSNTPSLEWMPVQEEAIRHMENDGIELMTFDDFYDAFLREKEEIEY